MSNNIIHPEEQNDLQRWANKWGISVRELTAAIIDTGFLKTNELKYHLKEKGVLFSFRITARRAKEKFIQFWSE